MLKNGRSFELKLDGSMDRKWKAFDAESERSFPRSISTVDSREPFFFDRPLWNPSFFDILE